jgi:hypothetical protein
MQDDNIVSLQVSLPKYQMFSTPGDEISPILRRGGNYLGVNGTLIYQSIVLPLHLIIYISYFK